MKSATVRSCWIAGLLVVAVPYTVLAFDMQWRTEAGRIGPGFFPRIIGCSLVVALLIALGQSLRARQPATERRDTGGAYLRTLLMVVAATTLFLILLEPLGALVSAVCYMLAVLVALNPGRWTVNIPIALGLPVGLYLLFQTWLNAGLPPGVLSLI